MKPLRIALPWLVGALILIFLLRRVDPGATWTALGRGEPAHYLPIAAGFALGWLVLDAAILSRLFVRAAPGPHLMDVLRMRAATYPLMIVSFHLASVSFVGRMVRATEASWSSLTATMIVYYLADLVALSGSALLASCFVEAALVPAVRPILSMILIAALLGLAFAELGRIPARIWPALERFRPVGPATLATVVAGRVAWYASFALFVWMTAPLFAVRVPLVEVAARMPLVLCVAALPIAPAGLGTTQAALLALFAPFGAPPELLAYGLVYGATLLLFRLPLGCLAWLPAPSGAARLPARQVSS